MLRERPAMIRSEIRRQPAGCPERQHAEIADQRPEWMQPVAPLAGGPAGVRRGPRRVRASALGRRSASVLVAASTASCNVPHSASVHFLATSAAATDAKALAAQFGRGFQRTEVGPEPNGSPKALVLYSDLGPTTARRRRWRISWPVNIKRGGSNATPPRNPPRRHEPWRLDSGPWTPSTEDRDRGAARH